MGNYSCYPKVQLLIKDLTALGLSSTSARLRGCFAPLYRQKALKCKLFHFSVHLVLFISLFFFSFFPLLPYSPFYYLVLVLDSKAIDLMNALMRLNQIRPGLQYKLLSQSGPVHAPVFTMSVDVDGTTYEASGPSKKTAKLHVAVKVRQPEVIC